MHREWGNMLESSLAESYSISDFIADNPLFYSLPREVIDSIASKFHMRYFAPDEVICQEGEIGDSFHLIRRGHVRVVKYRDGEELVLAELGPGEGFGEMALLVDQPRSATVKAIDDVESLILQKDDFTGLMRRIPELAEKMNRLLSERVSLLETEDSGEDVKGKFSANRYITLDYTYLDLLMHLNEAAGGTQQVEHCKETGLLAKEMSKMLCPMVSEEILFAGYLHEIGKVALAGDLVKRERRGEPISEEEQAKVDRIFDYAVEILEPNRSLHDSVEFIRYLSKKSYQDMPLEAQILKVADDYLMLRSPAYRALSDDEALARIKQGSGTLYNPRVVAALEKNVRKYSDLRVEGQLNVMRMMLIALDRKDNYTFRHSMDVRDMAVQIAEKLKLNRKDMEYIRIGSELHDIGKIYIDESILNAPRRLTPEEFEIMKKHAEWSAEFFRDIPGMDDLVSIVRAHHEKWDGSGYPDGLAGTDIPFLARIMTIADVWSALTTLRVYRKKAFSPQKALEIMEEMAPGHFDPEVFPIFQDIVKQIIASQGSTTDQ